MKRIRAWLLVVVALVVLVGAGYFGQDRYQRWRRDRQMAMAREFLKEGDGRKAVLALRPILDARPDDVEASRMMADLAEASGAPNALIWRHRVVQLSPHSAPDRLALARLALFAGDTRLAAQALEGIAKLRREDAAYHQTAAALATALQNLPAAEAHLAEAVRLEPENVRSRLNYHALRLLRDEPEVQRDARAALEEIRRDPALKLEATRQLTLDALRHQDTARAIELSAALFSAPDAAFGDLLLRLEALRQAGDAGLEAALAATKQRAADESIQAYELARWMLNHGRAAEALAWVEALAEEVRAQQPMPVMMADLFAATGDWTRMLEMLDEQNWGEAEYLRYLQRSRALRGQRLEIAAKTDWTRALRAAAGRPDLLANLYRNTEGWNWDGEQEEVLWAMLEADPGLKWVQEELYRRYLAAGQTRSLLTLFSRIVEADPNDLDAKNNLALTALLLGARERKPDELAEEVYRAMPTNGFYASTYALSLLFQARQAEALEVLSRLSSQALKEPAIAAYYTLALRVAGKRDIPREYEELAAKASLLPEEKDLLERLQGSL